MRHANTNKNHHDRSRQNDYADEMQQDYYPATGYSAERLPYPDAASAQLHQQRVVLEQRSRRMDREQQIQSGGHRNEIAPYADEDIQYHDRMTQSDFNNMNLGAANKPVNGDGDNNRNPHIDYTHAQNLQREHEQEDQTLQEGRDDERYAELYEEVFAPRSRTPSGMMTSTEHTRGTQAQTSSSRSTSRSGSSTSSSSESGFDDDNWEDNIMSALNDMAGNLKNIGGIHCSQAGPDSTEVQLKLNLPLPMQFVDNLDVVAKEGFNNAMATLSPKKCNMQYDYSHLDDQVFDMEERFVGTMNQLQGNMMPVYKSLFHSQSESSDDDEVSEEIEDESQSTYEDPRFLPKVSLNLQRRRRQQQEHQQQEQIATEDVVDSSAGTQNINGIPSHIIISDEPSGVSSSDSWKLSSPRDKPPTKSATTGIITTIDNNLDVAIRGSRILSDQNENNRRNTEGIPATKQRLVVESRESAEREKKVYADAKASKSKPEIRNLKSHIEIPQVIDCTYNVDNAQNIPESYSDLTFDFRKSTGVQISATTNSDKATTNVPMIKTHFSGDEIMGCSKASFQRNSSKKGTLFNSGLNDHTKIEPVVLKSDPPTERLSVFQLNAKNKPMDAPEVIFEE